MVDGISEWADKEIKYWVEVNMNFRFGWAEKVSWAVISFTQNKYANTQKNT